MSATRRRGDEAGSVAIWLLGLSVALLFLGGIGLDLWHAFSERRELAGAVDAAAIAGASALDENAFRSAGEVRLAPGAATAVACGYLRTHTRPPSPCDAIRATADAIEVTASREVPLTLTKVLLPGQAPLRIEVTARVEPRRAP